MCRPPSSFVKTYTSAWNLLCGVIEPGFANHLPALHVLALRAATRRPTLSPASPLSSSLRNISTPVDHLLHRRPDPDDLHLLADIHLAALDPARHHRAAARDREHVLDRHQERLVDVALRLGNVRVHRRQKLPDRLALVSNRRRRSRRPSKREPRITGMSSPGKSYFDKQLPHFELNQVARALRRRPCPLVDVHDHRGTPTWRASRMCSRVCGIGPSAADTTRIAPSICAAPVIMFFT